MMLNTLSFTILFLLFGLGLSARRPRPSVPNSPYMPRKFRFFQRRRTWDDARKQCLRLGGDLATINTLDEDVYAAALVGKQDAWIGVNDKKREGQYVAADGSPLRFTKWYKNNEPDNIDGNRRNADCTKIMGSKSGTWDVVRCNRRLPYICSFTKYCRLKYKRKYPACRLLKCWSGFRDQFDTECVKRSNCDGYSFNSKQIRDGRGYGNGCMVTQCKKHTKFHKNRLGYRECVDIRPKFRRVPTGRKRCDFKYINKYPSCVSIRCWSGIATEFESACKRLSNCNGYVLRTAEKRITRATRYSGCLKQECVNDGNRGYGFNDRTTVYRYYECKVPGRTISEMSQMTEMNTYSQYQNNVMIGAAGIIFVSIGGIITVFRNSRRRRQEEEYELIISDEV